MQVRPDKTRRHEALNLVRIPQSADEAVQLRMLEFFRHFNAMCATRGRAIGQPVSAAVAIESFCRFMHDNKDSSDRRQMP